MRSMLPAAAALTLWGCAHPAGSPPVQLGPPVVVGSGGADGFVTVDRTGGIHVVFGGRYRSGRTVTTLGPEETVTALPFHTARMTVDGQGRPHVVFTTGQTSAAKVSQYTARLGGRWLPPEVFANAADFPERTRAYVADVAVDDQGHVLVAFWVSRPMGRRQERHDPSFHYRWRAPDGRWDKPRSLPSHWSSAPKVEWLRGRGFLLLWQNDGQDWRVAGPIAAGQSFPAEGRATGSASLVGVNHVQNEGADIGGLSPAGFVVAGNVRERFEGPVGVWASLVPNDAAPAARYLGSFPGTRRGNESGVHPVVARDADTGHVVLTVRNPADDRAVFAYHAGAQGWLSGTVAGTAYFALLPEHPGPQGTTRQGPSVADLPGPGVIALVRDGHERWYLRSLKPPP